MRIGKRNLWIVLIVFSITLIVLLQILRHFFSDEERKARTHIRETIEEKYPETINQLKATFGLRPYGDPDAQIERNSKKTRVVLVHGLDDPGKIWMNLAPALFEEGFPVWILTYPNDQPVSKSARFFLKQIELHNGSGKGSISIVTHSMGGLVAREMLTNSALLYTKKAGRGELPRVKQLIMVGTPNHGSELARFRLFTEFRDQFENLFKGNYHWLQGIVDGAGEAGIDLIPESKFLKRLNSRPHPANVSMLIIAGVMSQMQKDEIEEFARNLAAKLPGDTRVFTKKMEKVLLSMSEQIGDGLVSVDSARLPGVPFKIVKGTHLSMIRNITSSSERIPPAIPIIIEQLNRS